MMQRFRQMAPRKRFVASGLAGASVILAATAVWLLAFPFLTDVRAETRQRTLRVQLASAQTKSGYLAGNIEEGAPVTRIVIPAIGLDAVVVEGTSGRALNAGAGHYVQTPLPGDVGNVAIAGHSSMNGKLFGNLDRLKPGDTIDLITPFARHAYRVSKEPWVVAPNDWTVIAPTTDRWLTLTTCYPRGSAKQRLVVRAQLVSTEQT